MYSSTLPSYDFDTKTKKGKGGKSEPVVNADDPKNRAEVIAILRGEKF